MQPTNAPESGKREASMKILSCIDRALDCYGDSVKQVIYWNFEKQFNITRDKIPDHPEKFVEALEKIFGGGAGIVERTIVNEISSLPGMDKLGSDDLTKALRTGCKHFLGMQS